MRWRKGATLCIYDARRALELCLRANLHSYPSWVLPIWSKKRQKGACSVSGNQGRLEIHSRVYLHLCHFLVDTRHHNHSHLLPINLTLLPDFERIIVGERNARWDEPICTDGPIVPKSIDLSRLNALGLFCSRTARQIRYKLLISKHITSFLGSGRVQTSYTGYADHIFAQDPSAGEPFHSSVNVFFTERSLTWIWSRVE